MDKENVRFYIKVRTALGIEARTIHDELYTGFGDKAPSYRTVARWSHLFREDRKEVEDEDRPGRPVTETTSENIEQVQSIIDDDPFVTVDELQEQTGLSHGTVYRIVSDHLKLMKITARYVPKHLTDFQRAERVRICKENLAKFERGSWKLCDVVTGDESWFYHKQTGRKLSNAAWVKKGDPPPTIVRRSRFAPRTLVCIFFNSTGPLLIHYVQREQTIDHEYYIENCLYPVINEIKSQRSSFGTRSIKLHHDNGTPHFHQEVLNYLESEGITVMPHPPNSPDLAPCDFWLFDLIKRNLDDQDDSESLHRAITEFMNSMSIEEYKKTFDKWIQRMQLCVDNEGDYFEHLMK
ncbi:unnamed protein product [Rotaria sp. Silwood2]|nr:unnamed protein product [Rotaria sp. Silwood2]CAF3061435.1 unnamed protein product [Rotaria sp. Silwood2]CAF3371190.1 unnamed protein product [Rotaria sp. Silwood2]CAF4386393.1 unnamed protein product [Rotaria sp. Silwood2]